MLLLRTSLPESAIKSACVWHLKCCLCLPCALVRCDHAASGQTDFRVLGTLHRQPRPSAPFSVLWKLSCKVRGSHA
jgi:hypothetical protein